jgi:ParB family transcriptional regulator, chromosome partitioning protein
MAEHVKLLDPRQLQRNAQNPRLIFREEELKALEESIAHQGILVPLTVYADGNKHFILDGERRWRCAKSLGLSKVPVIVQPKPDRLQNLMMMFAIHNARKDWDPLPTALKLEELEDEFRSRHDRHPTESELAGIASLRRGEVRRLKKLLALPFAYRAELLAELEKPRSQQVITVDHVIESTKAAEALRKADIIAEVDEDKLRRVILGKFRSGVIQNTVAPRKLVKMAQAVKRSEVSRKTASAAIRKIIATARYGIDEAYQDTVERADFEHSLDQLAQRLTARLEEMARRKLSPSPRTLEILESVASAIRKLR